MSLIVDRMFTEEISRLKLFSSKEFLEIIFCIKIFMLRPCIGWFSVI